MIFKKKQLESISQELVGIRDQSKEFEVLKKQNSELFNKQLENNKLLMKILEKIKELEENQNYLSGRFEDEVKKIEELNRKFEGRINSFKALETAANKKLFEETNLEIKSQIQSLFVTTQSYKDLEKCLKELQRRVDSVGSEVEKFSVIAGEVKAADFELANFAKQVTKLDQEKLSLMRENERLKLLISKERRRGRGVF